MQVNSVGLELTLEEERFLQISIAAGIFAVLKRKKSGHELFTHCHTLSRYSHIVTCQLNPFDGEILFSFYEIS
jgi:hypothetical protein